MERELQKVRGAAERLPPARPQALGGTDFAFGEIRLCVLMWEKFVSGISGMLARGGSAPRPLSSTLLRNACHGGSAPHPLHSTYKKQETTFHIFYLSFCL